MSSIVKILDLVPTDDWYVSFFSIIIITSLLLMVEIGIRYFKFPAIYTRKFIHILTGLIICLVAYLITSNIPIIIFASLYIFIDLWALRTGKFKSIHPDSQSLGTVFYAISVIILSLLFWGNTKSLFIITNLIMIIPDAMAALVGEHWASRYFTPVYEKKSALGSLTMFVLTVGITFISLDWFFNNSATTNLHIATIIGAIATTAELLSFRGSDNLSVPLFSGLFLYAILFSEHPDILTNITIGIAAAALVSIVSYKINFLETGGSALAFLMGSIIFGLGGWKYTFPILGFFIFSSLLSKIGKHKKKQLEATYQKTGVRDFHQALANGGVATILVIIGFISKIDSIYYIYIASLAAATADTWATELGIFSRKYPRLITNFKSVKPGTSGGISLVGSMASLLGSLLIVSIGYIFYPLDLIQFCIIVLFGFLGSLIDSLTGATLQGQYQCKVCHQNTESKIHCNTDTNLIKGKVFIDNDLVNLFSICFSSFLTFLYFYKEIF